MERFVLPREEELIPTPWNKVSAEPDQPMTSFRFAAIYHPTFAGGGGRLLQLFTRTHQR